MPADTTLNGVRVYYGEKRIGTVWHSNIWGWQWARWLRVGWVGGQCSDQSEGFRNVTNMKNTGADHARNYRQRQRAKMERMKVALWEINKHVEYSFDGIVGAPQALTAIGDFAKQALAD